jgi:hypothetical protein
MSDASLPVILQYLENLSAILDKAASYCEARKIDPAVLLNCRLFPDMFPLVRQVQIVTDNAKGMTARLAGIDVPSYADTETTFPELKARLAKTIAFVSGVAPEQINGSEDRAISFKAGPTERHFTGQRYLTHYALPNFFFHLMTAYAILRSNGLDIGKKDFLGPI